jgi:hypothetical protein
MDENSKAFRLLADDTPPLLLCDDEYRPLLSCINNHGLYPRSVQSTVLAKEMIAMACLARCLLTENVPLLDCDN